MDSTHRCISVELRDRQPFYPAMCQIDYRVTLDVAPDKSWEALGFELGDVRKAGIWHPIDEDHPLWLILARDVREPKPADEVLDAIRHVDWTARNWATAGMDPAAMRGLMGHGIVALDPVDKRRAGNRDLAAALDGAAVRELEPHL